MYNANGNRYNEMKYNRCGKSGLKLSAVALGLWQNFGYDQSFANIRSMIHTAFNAGIVHFDLANNYGGGGAEVNFGRVLADMRSYRDEMCISTKAGYGMWPGPYGDRNGSRKYLISSLDQSLGRMGLEYVDIFYHHATDPGTPIEETALALDHIVHQGKALYIGISNYNRAQTAEILSIFRELKTPFVINQPSYSMLNRWVEHDGLDDYAVEQGFGLAVYSPLHQGLLTSRYLNGIPESSRAARGNEHMIRQLEGGLLQKLQKLNELAGERGQTLSQMALAWVLRNPAVATVIIGASRPEQITDNVGCIKAADFSAEELAAIDEILK